jgi:hypothetical protein
MLCSGLLIRQSGNAEGYQVAFRLVLQNLLQVYARKAMGGVVTLERFLIS